MPTLDDIPPQLSRAKVCSLADVRNGFWHVNMDEYFRKLTAFRTPYGRYVWNRMPFGITPAPEVFQMKLHQCLEGLEGIFTIADDTLIVGEGSTHEEAVANHDQRMTKFRKRCQERNIRLNESKLQLKMTSLTYVGHLLTSEGLKPDPQKVAAVQHMPAPTDFKGARRLLGVVNYLARFMPLLADICRPIRQLTKMDVPWRWTEAEEEASFRENQKSYCF